MENDATVLQSEVANLKQRIERYNVDFEQLRSATEQDLRRMQERVIDAELTKRLNQTERELGSKLGSLEEKVRDDVAARLEMLKRIVTTGVVMVGLTTAVIGALGLTSFIPRAVTAYLEGNYDSEIEDALAGLQRELSDAKVTKEEIRILSEQAHLHYSDLEKRHPVAVQADFGPFSVSAASLRGSVLRANRAAVLTTLSDPITENTYRPTANPFSNSRLTRQQAGWFLARTIEDYPPKSVFVSVVDAGVLSNDLLIVRTRQGEHALIGYDTDVFDLPVARFEHKETYKVNWAAIKGQLEKEGIIDWKVDDSKPSEIIGTLAGLVSKEISPWSKPELWRGAVQRLDEYPNSAHITTVEPMRMAGRGAVYGKAMEIDGFGNIVTNLTRSDLVQLGFEVDNIDSYIQFLYVKFGGPEDPVGLDWSSQGQERYRLSSDFGPIESAQGRYTALFDGEYLMLSVSYGDLAKTGNIELYSSIEICPNQTCEDSFRGLGMR